MSTGIDIALAAFGRVDGEFSFFPSPLSFFQTQFREGGRHPLDTLSLTNTDVHI